MCAHVLEFSYCQNDVIVRVSSKIFNNIEICPLLATALLKFCESQKEKGSVAHFRRMEFLVCFLL